MSAAPMPVVSYDRVMVPILAGALEDRLDRCRSFARRAGHRVVALPWDDGRAAMAADEQHGEWPLLTHRRPGLQVAPATAVAEGAGLLVARIARLSAHDRCIADLLVRWCVPIITADDGRVREPDPATALP